MVVPYALIAVFLLILRFESISCQSEDTTVEKNCPTNPDNVFAFDDKSNCLVIEILEWEYSYFDQETICGTVTLGGFEWRPPKLDTSMKNTNLKKILEKRLKDKNVSFWIDLMREDETDPKKAADLTLWADPSKWNWNPRAIKPTSLSSFQGQLPWKSGNPDNRIYINKESTRLERCVLAILERSELTWEDKDCEWNTSTPMICETDMTPKTSSLRQETPKIETTPTAELTSTPTTTTEEDELPTPTPAPTPAPTQAPTPTPTPAPTETASSRDHLRDKTGSEPKPATVPWQWALLGVGIVVAAACATVIVVLVTIRRKRNAAKKKKSIRDATSTATVSTTRKMSPKDKRENEISESSISLFDTSRRKKSRPGTPQKKPKPGNRK